MKSIPLLMLSAAAVICGLYPIRVTAQIRERQLSRADAIKDPDAIKKHTSIALLVGVGDYDKAVTGLPPLKYPVPDISSVASVLKQQGYEISMLTDRSATSGNIRESFRELARSLDSGEGTFLFYFAGHGFKAGNENYLATFGTTMADLQNQGLAVSEVEKMLKATGAKRRLAFLDACRNDPEGTRGVGAPTRSFARSEKELKESEGLRVLLSTSPGDVSYEDDTLQHGVFTYFVLEGLSGKAAPGSDGLITFDDLRQYVTQQMKTYGIEHRKFQRPFQMGESSGDFLLAKRQQQPAVPIVVASVPQSVPPAQLAPVQSTQSPLQSPANSAVPTKGIGGLLKGENTTQESGFIWQSDAHPGVQFNFRFDTNAIYLRTKQGVLLGTLNRKVDKGREIYEGLVPLSPASACPGGRGAMQVLSYDNNRLNAQIEVPQNANGQVTCGGVANQVSDARPTKTGLWAKLDPSQLSRLLRRWQPVTFVKE